MEANSIQGNFVKGFLDVLFKHKLMILLFFLATVLTASIGVSFFQKVHYYAHSKVFIEANRGYVPGRSLPTDDLRHRAGGLSLQQQIDLALEVLRDNELTTRVVKKIGPSVIYEDIGKPGLKGRLLLALGWRSAKDKKPVPVAKIAALRLQEELYVKRAGRESSIIKVGFRHENPEVAANVVNSVVDFYIERHLGLHKKPQLTRFFKDQYVAKEAALVEAERKFHEFKDTHGITSSPEEIIGFLLGQKRKNQIKLDETISQEAELGSELKLLRAQLANNTAKNAGTVYALHKKLDELKVREGELSTRYKDDSGKVKNLRAAIRKTEDRLARFRDDSRYGSKYLSSSSPLYDALQEQLMQTALVVDSLKVRREVITAQLAEYDARIEKLDGLQAEFTRREEALSLARRSYKLYQTKFEEFRIFDALDDERIANIKVLEPARIPLSPIPNKTRLIMLLSVFFGLVGGISLALFVELFSGSLRKREDAEQYLKRPVLATIPEYELQNDATPGTERKSAW